ncbi:MAG TPA: hypothetical protein PKL15_10110, partial [Saprospiraceae bacterium]|nr:hypothetical protein [Saprospiraceae bacterium]
MFHSFIFTMFFIVFRMQGRRRFSLVLSMLLTTLEPVVESLQAQSGVPDSMLLRTVVIQSTRAGSEVPVPHTNFSAEKIRRLNQAQD